MLRDSTVSAVIGEMNPQPGEVVVEVAREIVTWPGQYAMEHAPTGYSVLVLVGPNMQLAELQKELAERFVRC